MNNPNNIPIISLAEIAASGTIDPDRNGTFWAKIRSIGDNVEPVSYVSPYASNGAGGIIAIPEPGVEILVCKPVGSERWYYMGSTFEPEPEQATTNATVPDSQIKPLARIDPYMYRARGIPMRMVWRGKDGEGLTISEEDNPAFVNHKVELHSSTGKKVSLIDSPNEDAIILDSNNHSKIMVTNNPQRDDVPPRAVIIESQGPQWHLNKGSGTDIAVLNDGKELQLLNEANGVPYGDPPGVFDPSGPAAGNVNIQSAWHDVNVFAQAEKGRIFIECLNTTGVDQVIEIQTNGENGAIRIKTNGKVDIEANHIGISASGNINMKAAGAINIEAGSDLSLKSGGTVFADGAPNIRLNEGGSQSADPDIGNTESIYGNTGITTYTQRSTS